MRGERDERARSIVLEQLRAGASVSAAAKAAGCVRQLVYSWRDRGDVEVAEALARRAARAHEGGGAAGLVASASAALIPVPAPRAPVPCFDVPETSVLMAGDGPPPPAAPPNRDEVLWHLQQIVRDPDVRADRRVAAAKALLAALPRPERAAPPAAATSSDAAPAAPAGDDDVERFRFVPAAG